MIKTMLILCRNPPVPEVDLSGEIARRARRVVRTMNEAEILPHRRLTRPKAKVKEDQKDPLGAEMKSLVMEWTTLHRDELGDVTKDIEDTISKTIQ